MKHISKTTIFIGLFIIVSASFARQLMGLLKAHIGETGFIILIGLILAVTGLALFVFTIRNNPGLIRIAAVMLILIVGLILAWQMRIPEEKIHILEYGVLGWFAARDLISTQKRIRGIILACIFSTFIGISDEVFQAILPYRVFDFRDIGFNSLGGMWGIILYLLGKSFYPYASYKLKR